MCHVLTFLLEQYKLLVCRIKALTTGRISSYADVVRNFASQQLQGDSIVEQWKLNNRSLDWLLLRLTHCSFSCFSSLRVSSRRRMVFYGDETWVRLFPSSFLRQDPTTSFFVTDYTEVEVEGRSGVGGCAGRLQRHQAPRPGAG